MLTHKGVQSGGDCPSPPPPSGQVLTVGKSFHSFKPTNRIQIPAKLEKGYAGATISNILQLIETTKIPKKSCVSKNKL